MLHIHPVAHALTQVGPLTRVFHYVLPATPVVVLDAYAVAYILFGDAQLFLHAEFHGQAVCVPSGFAIDLLAVHRLVTAESILQASCQHVVDAWVAVCRWWSFEEDKLRAALSLLYAFVEEVLLLPFLQHLSAYLREVQTISLGEILLHDVSLSFLLGTWVIVFCLV